MTSLATTFAVGDRVWYKSSDGTEMKARVTKVGDELDLNVRDDADLTRVRLRGDEEASDDDEYDHLEEEEEEEEDLLEVTAEKLIDTPPEAIIESCSSSEEQIYDLAAWAKALYDAATQSENFDMQKFQSQQVAE